MQKCFTKSLVLFLFFSLFILSCSLKETRQQENASVGKGPLASREIASADPEKKARRVINNQQFENIGYILKDGRANCTGTVIKHGVFLTAKHCFSGRQFGGEGLKHFSLSFITKFDPPEKPFIVSSENLIRVFPDEGFNDLAYVLYKPEATIGKINLVVNIDTNSNFDDLNSLMLFGFPKVELKVPQKISSENCFLGEMLGRYRKYPKSLHYRGDLIDTNCPAYYGNSGGPAVGITLTNSDAGLTAKMGVIGVVAHTFNDENAVQKDEFGFFVDNANISLIKDAKNLSYILNLDVLSLSDKYFLGNKKNSLNSPEVRISDWVISRKDFPFIFYYSKSFWKKNRDQNQIAKKRQEYEGKYSNYQSKCPIESNRVQSIFRKIIQTNHISEYLEGDNGLKVFVDCENGGLDAGTWFGSLLISKGMINKLKTEGTLACLVAHELSHHLLKHDQISNHEILVYRKELDADSLGFALAAQSGFSKHDCAEFLNLNAMIDGAVAGSEDPYPSSYERLQNLNDIVIKR